MFDLDTILSNELNDFYCHQLQSIVGNNLFGNSVTCKQSMQYFNGLQSGHGAHWDHLLPFGICINDNQKIQPVLLKEINVYMLPQLHRPSPQGVLYAATCPQSTNMTSTGSFFNLTIHSRPP